MGIIFSKLRLLPFALFSVIANVISQMLYLGGYVLWFVASYLYPEHPRLKDQWYGFSQFKEQSRVSAALGTIASILSVIALFYPVVIIPALWLFFASNVVWSISHYHKLRNPPDFETNYSENSQVNYMGYTILTTCVSLITAVCITISILFPLISFAVLTTSTILGLILTLYAVEYQINCSFNTNQTDDWKGTNYSEMSSELSASQELRSDLDMKSGYEAPSHPSLFGKIPGINASNLNENLVDPITHTSLPDEDSSRPEM